MKTFARQILKEESDIPGSEKVVYASKVVVGALERQRGRKQKRLWQMPAVLCHVQMFL